jgi:hypoxanthine phosphoribosyltransferase
MKKEFISWDEYGHLIGELIEAIKKDVPAPKDIFDGVYGIKNGGLPVALAIHHAFGLPLLDKPTSRTLIVDDISDTGRTLAELGLQGNKTAAIFSTPWTKVMPDWHVRQKRDKKIWIVFPYENKESEGNCDI